MTRSSGTDPGLGERLKVLRTELGVSLDDLAARSGLGADEIAKIESGERFPVGSIVLRLCSTLGVTLPELLRSPHRCTSRLNRRADQLHWSRPDSMATCRKLTPDGTGALSDLLEFEFPPGVAYDYQDPPPLVGIDRQVFVIDGTLDLTIIEAGQATAYQMTAGDCIHLAPGARYLFRNDSGAMIRCLSVVTRA
ncbi:XRE family transcriptional regulator [Blastochloris viridis]|nr:XRE family transcriptional regulator [Blastochloris viridis]ALK10758.1 Helix-turn-helix domain protein [Blastochloris viridis]